MLCLAVIENLTWEKKWYLYHITNINIEKAKKRLATDIGKKIYAERKHIIEPVFGVIKHIMKFRQFLLRGLEKAKAEWKLVCLAYNSRKICIAKANKKTSNKP